MAARDAIVDLRRRVAGDIIGQQEIVERLLIGLLANGNSLVERLPGLRCIKQTSLPGWLPHRQRFQRRDVMKVPVRGQQCQVMM